MATSHPYELLRISKGFSRLGGAPTMEPRWFRPGPSRCHQNVNKSVLAPKRCQPRSKRFPNCISTLKVAPNPVPKSSEGAKFLSRSDPKVKTSFPENPGSIPVWKLPFLNFSNPFPENQTSILKIFQAFSKPTSGQNWQKLNFLKRGFSTVKL